MIQSIPVTATKLQAIREAQASDEVCQKLFDYCKHGWPHVHNLSGPLRPYHSVASQLTVHNGLLLKGTRIVIPSALHLDILDQHVVVIKASLNTTHEHNNLFGGQDLVYNCKTTVLSVDACTISPQSR